MVGEVWKMYAGLNGLQEYASQLTDLVVFWNYFIQYDRGATLVVLIDFIGSVILQAKDLLINILISKQYLACSV